MESLWVLMVVVVLIVQDSDCQVGHSHHDNTWVKLDLPHHNHTLHVTFAIKQANPEWLVEKIHTVSSPDSPEYGHYMNFDEIVKYVHGEPVSVRAVLDALQSVGVPPSKVDFTLGKDFAVVSQMPVKIAEELFSAVFYRYTNPGCGDNEGVVITTAESHTLPPYLVDHVDFVSGVSGFPVCNDKKGTLGASRSHPNVIKVTPELIAQDYNTSSYISTNSGNSQAVASFVGQFYSPSDLSIFQTKFSLPDKPVKIVGKNIPNTPGTEGTLDIQYIVGTGRGVSTWYVSVSGDNGFFVKWVVSQINTTDSPWVHSVSYGGVETGSLEEYRLNNELMKFGISGRTVLFASGDSGVNCEEKTDGKRAYSPEFPASSPYVTTVGGTESRVSAWSHSGGGFSNFFPMPVYQKDAVEAYMSKLPDTSMFNTSGRAYPDVSAYAVNCLYVINGKEMQQDGTSCAAPIFAGLVASLNDKLLNDDKKSLGFLNPLLYKLKGEGFEDIKSGQNSDNGCKGFLASEGWDATSGWGTPNLGLLMNLLL